MLVRLAMVEDAAALARVHVLAWQAAYRGLMPDAMLAELDMAERARGWHQRLAAGLATERPVWVVSEEGSVTGFCATGPPRDPDVPAGSAEIYAINLLPEMWRKGQGRALFEHAIADLRARGHERVVLWVVSQNSRARAFYEAEGMQPDGRDQTTQRGGAPLHEVRYAMPL
jgi:GNAT superfamily N-acetyltransferase